MRIDASNVREYLEKVPDDRKEYFNKLRDVILAHIPEGFHEEMSYGMIGYVVPHSIYPAGYHCAPELPLPFVSIASQKNNIALYHMGIYADSKLLKWFKDEYPKHTSMRLDMGKSCIRFRKASHIPFNLIGLLMEKITVNQWIAIYEKEIKKK